MNKVKKKVGVEVILSRVDFSVESGDTLSKKIINLLRNYENVCNINSKSGGNALAHKQRNSLLCTVRTSHTKVVQSKGWLSDGFILGYWSIASHYTWMMLWNL